MNGKKERRADGRRPFTMIYSVLERDEWIRRMKVKDLYAVWRVIAELVMFFLTILNIFLYRCIFIICRLLIDIMNTVKVPWALTGFGIRGG
jgi:hypothetical protein